jgi:putative peptide zinc metalloprotease protein
VSPLCDSCKRYHERDLAWCRSCGRPLSADAPALDIVLDDGTHVALVQEVMIGRAPRNAIRFTDPSVSRVHARIGAPRAGCAPELSDAGSAHGTWLDGKRVTRPAALYHGASIRLGDTRLRVQQGNDDGAGAGRTIVIRSGMSLVVPIVGGAQMSDAPLAADAAPTLRPGLTLKRMPAGEGALRWVLRDPVAATALRLGEPEAQLLELLDGRHSVGDLFAEAESRGGAAGAAVLLRLVADLGEHGLLAGVEGPDEQGRWPVLRRVLTPHELVIAGAPAAFDRIYRGGGYRLFTTPALATMAALAVAGFVAFAVAIAGDYATPFVVSRHVGVGLLAFVVGRLLVVALHELAHGLTLAAFDRRAQRAGVKFVLGFPYAFVDTSAALLEPRHRRLAVSGSGPFADLVAGGVFALICVTSVRAETREVSLQIALAAYTGALFNLNPLLDRDGYHMLVDWLGIPNLRRQARAWLAAGARRDHGSGPVAWYALATIGWSLLAAAFVVVMTLRYKDRLLAIAPDGIVWILVGCCWALVLVPAAVAIARPVRSRARAAEGVAA